jgi:virulence-associated protein VagC
MTKKRTRYTIPTLTLEYMIHGDKVFKEALEAGTTTWNTIHKVLDKLAAADEGKAKKAKAWVQANEPEKPASAKGRTPPEPGDTRTYSVQKLNKGGGRFIRLPVDLLSDDKGDSVIVEYHENKIVIRPGGAQATSEKPTEEAEEAKTSNTNDLLAGFDAPKKQKRTIRRKRSA